MKRRNFVMGTVTDRTAPLDALGQQLRAERLKWKLTQRELSERSGVTQATIDNIELGTANPSYKTLTKICGAMGYELRFELKTLYRRR